MRGELRRCTGDVHRAERTCLDRVRTDAVHGKVPVLQELSERRSRQFVDGCDLQASPLLHPELRTFPHSKESLDRGNQSLERGNRMSYSWPLQPFDRVHPVRANFNDPRISGSSKAFHFGIDISAPNGTPVYAVEAGKVHIEDPRAIAVAAGSVDFGYWHVVPV